MNWELNYRWPDLPRVAGVALFYVLLANIVLGYFSANGVVSIVWPPSGLALAALLIGGKKYWPGIFVGALVANIMAGSPVWVSAFIAAGNTLEPLLGAWLLTRNTHFDALLRYPRDYFRLILLAGIASPAVSAVNGTAILLLSGFLTQHTLLPNLVHWWMGDTLGIILLAPLILIWQQPRDWLRQERAVEAVAGFGLAFLAGQVVFLDWFHDALSHYATGTMMIIFVAWGAVRFGRHGVLLLISMIAIQALLGAALKVGHFGDDIRLTQLTNFWLYMVELTIVGMGLATTLRERKHLEQQRIQQLSQLHESEERFHSLFHNAPFGISHSLPEGRFLSVNPALARILGYASPEELIASTTDISTQIYAYPQKRAELLAGAQPHNGWGQFENVFRRKDGSVITVNISGRKVLDAHGAIAYFEAFVEDITEKKLSEELIWKQANIDSLTQLPNRRLFHDRLAQEVKKANRGSFFLALLFIDLDRFKEVNDTLGHDAGDSLLIEAAQRVRDCVRESDTVARLGGDEFTVILTELTDTSSIDHVAQSIIKTLCEPFRLGDETVYISASIGITLYPTDATEIENLLKNADQAMYVAKDDGRNRFSHFTHSLQETAQTRQRLVKDLRNALAAHQFSVHFQPIVELATGRIIKAEALLRWQHPERGLVGPAEFIPIAEETGLIVDIGKWVFMESARWVKHWANLFPGGFQVSVNKSPVQFHADGNNHDDWLEYLQELGLTGQSIVIEITEGLLLNANTGITDKLLKFRDAGIQVAIDDFGTGYSALSYLKKFDIDYLKIDQSFVRNLATDSADMALSEAIIMMAHKLGLKVIAEGVETLEQRNLLAAAGCDYGQGYLFSRPVPPEAFEALLRANRESNSQPGTA